MSWKSTRVAVNLFEGPMHARGSPRGAGVLTLETLRSPSTPRPHSWHHDPAPSLMQPMGRAEAPTQRLRQNGCGGCLGADASALPEVQCRPPSAAGRGTTHRIRGTVANASAARHLRGACAGTADAPSWIGVSSLKNAIRWWCQQPSKAHTWNTYSLVIYRPAVPQKRGRSTSQSPTHTCCRSVPRHPSRHPSRSATGQ